MEGSYSLIASPSKITSTAAELSAQGTAIRSLSSEMTGTVTSISAAWTGANAEKYIQKFTKLQVSMDEIDAMIQRHANMLTEIAQNYERATSENDSELNSLAQMDSTIGTGGLEPPL